MHADRFDHCWAEPLLQLVGPHAFVPRVNTLICNVLTKIMQEMPVIMQEARYDDLRSFPCLLSKGGALQGMLNSGAGLGEGLEGEGGGVGADAGAAAAGAAGRGVTGGSGSCRS